MKAFVIAMAFVWLGIPTLIVLYGFFITARIMYGLP